MKADVIVIGAGASGLMCAMEAGKRGRSVLVLEHTDRVCNKVRISGGGRCNFTNRICTKENYLSRNPHFCTSALSRFTPSDFIAMLERRRIRYQEQDAGRLFCTESSREIVDMLQVGCDRASVKFLLNCKVVEIRKEERFSVSTSRGVLDCESLVIATGGLSMPAIGATNFGYEVARQFGMKVTPLMPALTPLRFNREEREVFGVLSGVSIDANVRYKDVSFRDSVLFTHRGLSGPAILQVSSYWDGGAGAIAIDLLPEVDIAGILKSRRNSKMLLSTLLGQHLPGRFVKVWCAARSIDLKPLNQYSIKELDCIADSLHNWLFRPGAAEGFDKAEVTLGGVDTGGLSSKTMESKKTPGLYFLGEVIDVTGQLGGYNLHWAWASGYAAGQCV